MTYTIRLCGGPGESQVIRLPDRAIGVYRFAVARPVTPTVYYVGEDENNQLDSGLVHDEIIYHDTGILAADGMRLYATVELLAQLRQAAWHRMEPPRVEPGLEEAVSGGMLSRAEWEPQFEEVIAEGMLPRSCWEPSVTPGMSGKREYPLDAIKREDTERLVREIDEVTGDVDPDSSIPHD
jgi:hypothetical protein